MNLRKITAWIMDFLILATAFSWALLLYRDFTRLPLQGSALMLTTFYVKILLFVLFIIAAITAAFYLHLLGDKRAESSSGRTQNVPDRQGEILREIENLKKIAVQPKAVVQESNNWPEKLEKVIRLSESRNFERMLDETVRLCSELTGASRVSIVLRSPGSRNFHLVRKSGFIDYTEIPREPFGTGISGMVFEAGKKLFVTDMESHPGIGKRSHPPYRTRSFIILPVRSQIEGTVGVLCLSEKTASDGVFSAADLIISELMVSILSLGLENSVLVSAVESQLKK